MSKLTPFGVELRKLRIDKELRLFDLAEKMEISSAMLSAVETGRKAIPDGFTSRIARALTLDAAEIRRLRLAADRTRNEVRVDHLRGDQREVVAAFARQLNDLPIDFFENVRNKLLKSVEGEVAFKRKRVGMLVPGKSRAEIEALAARVRAIFCRADILYVPIIEILELMMPKVVPSFIFDVWERDEMGADEGRLFPGKQLLVLRKDVYDAACKGDGRSRFTACHEFGHYVLHHDLPFSMARADSHPVYRDAEWQADTFAGHLMMPRDHARGFSNIAEAASVCGMSAAAASVMLSKHSIG